VQTGLITFSVLHARQPPQSAVVVSSVSQPVEGWPEQFAWPALQLSVQLALHVPSMALQHVPPQIAEPWLRVYEQGEPSTQRPCAP
jgi:hypothetical protein